MKKYRRNHNRKIVINKVIVNHYNITIINNNENKEEESKRHSRLSTFLEYLRLFFDIIIRIIFGI